jgi:hypothetical protein
VKAWEALFKRAVKLLDATSPETFWTMGGGTVLMLRHRHRSSKDIDIFFLDPQPLGRVNPRLGGLAEDMTSKYEESNGHVKLFFPEGEIDFVAAPLLTTPGFIEAPVAGRTIRLETDAEIVAKKMWYRGHEAKARDLFDLDVVIERSPGELAQASDFLLRHREAFIEGLHKRREILELQFNSIAALDYESGFQECMERVTGFLRSLDKPSPRSRRRS